MSSIDSALLHDLDSLELELLNWLVEKLNAGEPSVHLDDVKAFLAERGQVERLFAIYAVLNALKAVESVEHPPYPQLAIDAQNRGDAFTYGKPWTVAKVNWHQTKRYYWQVSGNAVLLCRTYPIITAGGPKGDNGPGSTVETTDKRTQRPEPKSKRSTERGEGREKLIAAFTKHHKYANGGCLNLEPIGNNELARLADVAKRTASAFFKKEFRGHKKYQAMCKDLPRFVAALKALNGEFRPLDFYDARTPDEVNQGEE